MESNQFWEKDFLTWWELGMGLFRFCRVQALELAPHSEPSD